MLWYFLWFFNCYISFLAIDVILYYGYRCYKVPWIQFYFRTQKTLAKKMEINCLKLSLPKSSVFFFWHSLYLNDLNTTLNREWNKRGQFSYHVSDITETGFKMKIWHRICKRIKIVISPTEITQGKFILLICIFDTNGKLVYKLFSKDSITLKRSVLSKWKNKWLFRSCVQQFFARKRFNLD